MPFNRNRRKMLTALASSVVLTTLAAFPGAPSDRLETASSELLDALAAAQQQHRIPVMALVLLDRGQPTHVSMRTLPAAMPLDSHIPFRWGSISKTVTAMALLEAARVHAVDLRSPVTDWLPQLPYRNPWAERYPVRLAHLLELTAGMPDLSRAEFDDNTPRPLETALLRGAKRRVLQWPPGLQHSYSNVPPGITAAVLSRMEGAPFGEVVARRVFRPLKMAGAGFQPQARLPGGFRADGVTPIPYWHVTFTAFGGLNASPWAMSRLLEALLNDGMTDGRQAISGATVDRMFTSKSSLGACLGLTGGYGAGIYSWVQDGHLFFGHGGDADGYLSRFGLLPAAGRGYLLGINTDNPSAFRQMRRHVEQALTADLPSPRPPEAKVVPASVLAGLAGRYHPASTRFAVTRWAGGELPEARITVHGDGLRFRRGSTDMELIPLTPALYRRPNDPMATVAFARYGDTLLMQGVLGNHLRLAEGQDFHPSLLSPPAPRSGNSQRSSGEADISTSTNLCPLGSSWNMQSAE